MYNTKSYRDLCAFCGVETQGVGQDTVATVRFEITKDEPEESSALQKESDFEIIDKEKIKTLLSRNYAFEKSTEIPAKLSVSEIKRKSASKTTFYKPAFMSDSVSGKDVGTATHSFLQFCDFSAITDYASFEKERQRLIDFEFITERFANLTDGEGVTAFLTSPKMRELVKTGTCKKEQKFIFTLPAREVTDIDSDEPVVIQGIIDCWFVVDNKAVIVDYKTDYVKTEAELIDRYKTQLDMYERAIFENYGIETQDKYIYSFCLKKFIKL
jgi:ATP-dependent helicase/nuclease subunit A